MKTIFQFAARTLLLAAVSACLALSARADIKYSLVNLSAIVPGASAIDINNAGDVLLSGNDKTYLYKGGVAYQIPTDFGLTALSGVSLNDHDQIVGMGTTVGGLRETYSYDFGTSTGAVTNLIPQNSNDQLLSLNNLGMTAVGAYTGTQYITHVFDSSGHSILPLGLGGNGLNNAGDLWVNESYTYNLITGQTSEAESGYSDGAVFGDNGWFAATSPSVLARGKLGDNEVPVTTLGTVSSVLYASDINGNGVVVGSIWKFPELYPYRAFTADQNGIVDLNDVAPLFAGNYYAQARAINDAGEIIGYFGNQDVIASGDFLLIPIGSPVPEASSAAWALGGLLIVGALAWRRRLLSS